MGKVRETMDALSHPALLLVDGVSSIGALDFQFDKWKVDVAVTGSQKALSLPTGLALVAISEKVRNSLQQMSEWNDFLLSAALAEREASVGLTETDRASLCILMKHSFLQSQWSMKVCLLLALIVYPWLGDRS